MIYVQLNLRRRTDININLIIQVQRKRNPATVDDERVEIQLVGGFKYRLEGQDAADFWDDWKNLIIPALGGIVNAP